MNRLPQVKTFLKMPGHADSYEDLKITWKHGSSPLLILTNKESGKEEERINLERMSTDELHRLMKDKGFEHKAKGGSG